MKNMVMAAAILCIGTIGAVIKLTRNEAVSYLNLAQRYSLAAQSLLRQEGFTVISAPGGANAFGAELSGCIMWAAPSQADGDNDTSFLVAYHAGADVLFLYENRTYDARPNFRFLLERLKVRGLRSVGITASVSPIFALAISKSCNPQIRSAAVRAVGRVADDQL